MAWTGWLTAEEAVVAPYWPTCDLEAEELTALLASAQVVCEDYAPGVAYAGGVKGATIDEVDDDDIPTEATVPENWRLAQSMQARALWRSSAAGSGDQIGGDGLTVTVFPMDWTVKALLRPPHGRPVIA